MDMVNLYDFMSSLDSESGSVTIVVPTMMFAEAFASRDPSSYEDVELAVREFIQNVMQLPNADMISGFEIGNEFAAWMGEDGEISSTSDYADIAINMSVWIEESLSHLNLENAPDIFLQTPFVMYGDRGVQQLVDNIINYSPANESAESLLTAAMAIDGLIIHNYTSEVYSGNEYQIDLDFDIAGVMQSAFSSVIGDSGLEPVEYDLLVSEWNVRNSTFDPLDIDPWDHAISILDQFTQLISMGADMMHVWPILHNTNNSLSYVDSEGEISLTPAGSVFSSLHTSVVGLIVQNFQNQFSFDDDSLPELLVHSFGNSNVNCMYFSNVTDEQLQESLDITGVITSEVETSYTLVSSSASNFSVDFQDGQLLIDLPPSSIIQVIFEDRALLEEELICVMPTRDIYSPSTDIVDDEVQIFGTDQDDILTGDISNDVVRGFSGHDNIDGGVGNDTLFANEGRDTLCGGQGDDVMHSGRGADTFVFLDNWGTDLITNFNELGGTWADRLDFSSVSHIDSFEDLASNHIVQAERGCEISDGLGNSVLLIGVPLENLTEDAFLF